jgi:hypothetical protein
MRGLLVRIIGALRVRHIEFMYTVGWFIQASPRAACYPGLFIHNLLLHSDQSLELELGPHFC